MTYTELKTDIEKVKEWLEEMGDIGSVEVHCMNDQLSLMEETLERMLPE